ncbi:helix-turn-helix domain-containing protein [Rhodopila sp.]|jgi:DNA-binding MarR family transcriptional regulator|uniref:helix-turn-helix domain-containing protein n=1 Tax=Rhodopila sp. TaxID=2480087 RepID=UPI002CA4AF9B|nr:helix-turn-helix domain-containing protein [Rhodopila sp.]HVZ06785.1 helix-turn-helix domain-containing protein [Rhodopila sp.]
MTSNPSGASEPSGRRARKLELRDYRLLSKFRYLIRCFLEFSEASATRIGLTARQHQALLAIKGTREDATPTIGYLAERLRIQHHSAVELVDRLTEAGLVERERDPDDRRRIKLLLTPAAEQRLAELSASHMLELQRLGPTLMALLDEAVTLRPPQRPEK